MSLISVILDWVPSVLPLLFCGLIFCLLCYIVRIKRLHMKYAHIPGPPLGNFLFGHALSLVQISNKGLIHDKFLEWSEMYGPVFKLHLLHHVMILTTCPETAKNFLMSSKHFKDKVMYSGLISLFGKRFLGGGIVTQLDHDKWYKQRRVMDPAFSSLTLKNFLTPINDYADRMMSEISAAVEKDSVANMTELINTFTLDVLAKIAFDIDSDTMVCKNNLTAAIKLCMEGMITHSRDPFFQFKSGNKTFINSVKDACQFIRKTGEDWISRRRTAVRNNESCPKDILTQIIRNSEQEANTTEEDAELMVDNFVTFFIAGQETTASQLAFCIRELGRYPEILKKVRKEVDEVVGLKQMITTDDISQLVYTSQFLKEILRLYPIAPLIPRRVDRDFVVNGLKIPGGVNLTFSPYVSGRLEKFFKDPQVLDPERFHPDAPKPYYCYYPFALGPRNCIGQNLSQMEAKVLLVKLIQRFHFTLTPGQNFGIKDTGSLKTQSDVTCFVKYRDNMK